ncbi:MAG TPA: gliding motility lipoprotein GldH [Draconibacterium sp.]|nr:gliding motility lipoprotein GldH [Draconibacterium sp.]
MRKFGFQFLTACILVIALLSCNSGGVFSKYKTIPKGLWHRDSLVVFQIPVTDTVQRHNLFLNVRNDINYKYSNLWLFIKIIQPGDTTAVRDTFEFTLADPTGKWLGEGFGGVKTNEMLFKRNVYFPVSGIYEIQIQHGMRGKLLEGITEVGFRVEKQFK